MMQIDKNTTTLSKMSTVTYQHYVESVIVDKVKMLYGVGCGGNGNKGSD